MSGLKSGQRHVVVHKFDVADPFELPDVIWEGREQVMKSSGHNESKVEYDPEYTIHCPIHAHESTTEDEVPWPWVFFHF